MNEQNECLVSYLYFSECLFQNCLSRLDFFLSIFTLVLFHGSSSLFNGPTCFPKTLSLFPKKDFHELASQLMSSPHMHVHPSQQRFSVCAPTLNQTLTIPIEVANPLEWTSHTYSDMTRNTRARQACDAKPKSYTNWPRTMTKKDYTRVSQNQGVKYPKYHSEIQRESKPSSTWSNTMTKKGYIHAILHRSNTMTHQAKSPSLSPGECLPDASLSINTKYIQQIFS